MVRVPPKFLEIYSGNIEEAIDAHSIQPYYTVLLAEEAGLTLSCSANADEVVFTAEPMAAG
jgi:histidine phosphotransferase ChpT